ncbi:MAG TPA: hypothetical protein VJ945_07740, partial [Flavobacteriaceae bacterium]|nr:hypothetical protein [Flavobacteriaceae bacterium]
TNWMRNFDEQNFYIQSIKVIDPENDNNGIPKGASLNLDAQFLPEGGHLLANTQNTMGVVIKDSLGFGVPFVDVHILNSKNEPISSFRTNQFGIGKFRYVPKSDELYHASIDFEEKSQIFNIDPAETHGITLSLNDLNNRIVLRFATNDSTLKSIQNKHYKLVIHNESEFKTTDIVFDETPEVLKLVNYDDLSPGINIFTLFDENNVPLLERLFFKYDGIQLMETGEVTFKKDKDSTTITIPFKDIDTSLVNKFSISVLPADTKSYNHHHNIISYIYLQPYVKSYIENAQYYFTDITRKKKYELDNLLLTQGWSSYNWNTVFNNPPTPTYPFEYGIHLKANINDSRARNFIIFPFSGQGDPVSVSVKKGDSVFERNGLFPFNRQKLQISKIGANDWYFKAGIYARFKPARIPEIGTSNKISPLNEPSNYSFGLFQPFLQTSWTEEQFINELLITLRNTGKKGSQSSNGVTLDVFDNTERNQYENMASYLSEKGFYIDKKSRETNLKSMDSSEENQMLPKIYIDGYLLTNYRLLSRYDPEIVDYVIIDKSPYREDFDTNSGIIKIFNLYEEDVNTDEVQVIDIPLTFSAPMKFYAPKYSFYSTQFYREYGVVDWLPDMSVDKNGTISFKISNQQATDIKLFIEGTANNGSFISEVKTVNIN